MPELSMLDYLICAFESRARLIARSLNSRYDFIGCDRFVTHFVMLHTDHVHCLRSGDFTTAYNLLRSIGRLSERMEREEMTLKQRSEGRKKRLKLREERFRRGPVVCCYVAGDFRQFSPMFDTSLSKLMADEPSILNIGIWSWTHAQRDAAEVYNRLAQNCQFLNEEVEVEFAIA